MTLSYMGAVAVPNASARAPQRPSAAPLSPSATPIVGGTSYGTAVAISADVEYSAILTGSTRMKDFFYVDVSPGEAITVDVTSTAAWSSGAVYVYLEDQAHTSYLTYASLIGAEQTDSVSWMGNSATPTRYYIRAETSSGNPANAYNYTLTMKRQRQYDGGAFDDAGETLATGRIISPVLGTTMVFTGMINPNDREDYFRVAAISGQIISVTYSVSSYGSGASGTTYAYLYDASSTSYLKFLTFSAPNAAEQSIRWMSSNTAPTGYGLRMQHASGTGATVYRVAVHLTQQSDGGATGDAGDGFDDARTITENTVAQDNLLGLADDSDYYKIDLPDANQGATYKLIVSPPAWGTQTSGYLTIRKFSANRAALGSPTYLQAPVLEPALIDITGCDNCYVQVEDQTSGTDQIRYGLSVRKPNYVYIPLIRR